MKKSKFAHIAFLLRPAEQETTIGRSRCRADTAPVRLLPNIGVAYREALGQLRQTLAKGDNPAALETARALIDRVTIHATAKRSMPNLAVGGHLAQMLAAAQPNLSLSTATRISTSAMAAMQLVLNTALDPG